MVEVPDCQICGKNPGIGVVSSSLGPISFSYCRMCLERQAESEYMCIGTIWSCGGVDKVADHVRDYVSVYTAEGEYFKWRVWEVEKADFIKERIEELERDAQEYFDTTTDDDFVHDLSIRMGFIDNDRN